MITSTGDARRPLAGRAVLVTRPRAQAAELIALLETAGATAVVAPTVRIVPPADPGPLQRAAADLTQFDWIVLSSANGVDALLDVAPTFSGPRDEGAVRQLPLIAAVGARTAERIRARGLDVAITPEEFRAEGLVAAMTSRATMAGARILFPRSEIGRDVIATGLRDAGAVVTEVIAYRTVAEDVDDDGAGVRRLLAAHQVDAVTFTSGSAVQSFVQLYGPDSVDLLQHTVVVVIGPVTANVAQELGVPVHVQPATYTTAAMVDALSQYFVQRA